MDVALKVNRDDAYLRIIAKIDTIEQKLSLLREELGEVRECCRDIQFGTPLADGLPGGAGSAVDVAADERKDG
jgi:hypothetical protein